MVAQTATLGYETQNFLTYSRAGSLKSARSASDLVAALGPLLPEASLRKISVAVGRLQPVPKRTLDNFLARV